MIQSLINLAYAAWDKLIQVFSSPTSATFSEGSNVALTDKGRAVSIAPPLTTLFAVWDWSPSIGVKIRRLIAVFFCTLLYPSYYGGVSKALEKVAAPMCGRPTLFILPPLIGLFVGRLKTCYIGHSTMNTPKRANSAQNSQTKTAIFNLYHHRKAIAHGINAALAVRFKSRYPACIVKFAAFEGGAI